MGDLGKGQKVNWWSVGLGRPVMPSQTKAEVGGSIASEGGEKAGGRREAGGIDAFCRHHYPSRGISAWNGQWTLETLAVFSRSIPAPKT